MKQKNKIWKKIVLAEKEINKIKKEFKKTVQSVRKLNAVLFRKKYKQIKRREL